MHTLRYLLPVYLRKYARMQFFINIEIIFDKNSCNPEYRFFFAWSAYKCTIKRLHTVDCFRLEFLIMIDFVYSGN